MGYRSLLISAMMMLLSLSITGIAVGEVDLKPMVSFDTEEIVAEDSQEVALGGGKVKIVPMITISSRMDSNFHKSENDEKTVYTYAFQPGINLGYETGKSNLLFGYTLNANYHDGDEDDYLGHTLNLSARIQPSSRLTAGLEDSFQITRDPARSDRFNNSVIRDKYFINRVTPSVLYEFRERFSIGLRYRNTLTEYDSEAEDSVEHRGTVDMIYNFTPATHLDLQYSRWKRDYDMATSDYTSDQLHLIFVKQLNHLSFEAGLGYHKRGFNDSDLNDMETFSYRFLTSWKSRTGSHVSLSAERNFNDAGRGNSYFKDNRFTLGAGHTFRKRLPTEIKATYRTSDYETNDREDETCNISAAIGYLFNDWLAFNLTTGYEERDSNRAENDYGNAYVMGNIDFRYDPGTR